MPTTRMTKPDHHRNGVSGTTARNIAVPVCKWMMLTTCIQHCSLGVTQAFHVGTSSQVSTSHGRISEASSLSSAVSTSTLDINGVEVDHKDYYHHDQQAQYHNVRGRGKRIQTPINPIELFALYKETQQEYQNKAFNPKAAWKVLSRRDDHDMEVALLEHADDPSCPYVRFKGRFPVPVSECWDFMKVSAWDRTLPKMDPFYEGVSIHGEYEHGSVQMILCRKRTKRIFAFGKRDLAILSASDETPLPDGTRVSGTVSLITNRLPRQPGYVRAFQDSIVLYKPVNNNTETELTILCRIDLNDSGENGMGGRIPMWLYVKTIGQAGLQSIIRMHDALVHESLAATTSKIQ